jgi:hypothetical protein
LLIVLKDVPVEGLRFGVRKAGGAEAPPASSNYMLSQMRYSAPTAAATAAAAAATATTAAAAVTTTATAAGAIFTRTGLVDVDGATAEVLAVQGLDRGVGLAGVGHLDEGESTGTTGLAIGDDGDIRNFTVGLEGVADFVFSSAKGEVSNEELHERDLCPAVRFPKATIRANLRSEVSMYPAIRTPHRTADSTRNRQVAPKKASESKRFHRPEKDATGLMPP